MGDNHDEGRTFAQGLAGLTEQQYADLVTQDYGARAPQVLQHYPFSSYPSPYTAAYAIGAVWTDSGFITGIGGCPAQNLAAQFARGTPTYVYQFDDRHAPGLNNSLPGYQWGAGHAMELAYLWPSFNNGFSLYDLLTPAQLELSHADGGVVGRVRALPRTGGARPARLAALHQRPADVAPARRPEPDDLRGHLRRRASVRLLERRLDPSLQVTADPGPPRPAASGWPGAVHHARRGAADSRRAGSVRAARGGAAGDGGPVRRHHPAPLTWVGHRPGALSLRPPRPGWAK